MASELMDRGCIVGTRINVYNLFDYFLDPTVTESWICKLYDLSPEQVAAARAYVLNNPEEVLAQHLKIEARNAAGNPPEVREAAKRTHELFMRYKAWLDERTRANEEEEAKQRAAGIETKDRVDQLRTFREWMIEQKSRPVAGP